LLGGVLKGQELIQSAKIKNVVSDFSSTTVAIYGYQDRYKALPGDDPNVVTRWVNAAPAPKVGNNDNIITGNFVDGVAGVGAGTEAAQFWYHLRLAGFVGGSGEGGPKNAYNGQLGIQDGNDSFNLGVGTGFKGIIVCESDIPDKAAAAIDNQLDDGNPTTGIIRAVVQAGVGAPVVPAQTPAAGSPVLVAGTTYVETGTTYYTMCKSQ
ncbi:MAG TPA: prepilin-type cleavage/methylation domain-containing protein, partial [Methylophilaceae bacterium]